LECEASARAYGAKLLQKSGGFLHPVGYHSGKFSPAELNHTVLERELVAILMSLKNWRYLLDGTAYTINVSTDHKTFEALVSLTISSEQHVRWALYLDCFDVCLTYLQGTGNVFPDLLSRLTKPKLKQVFEGTIWPRKEIASLTTHVYPLIIEPNAETKKQWL
jgi:RNase H-like domain found in reverse transcriptase